MYLVVPVMYEAVRFHRLGHELVQQQDDEEVVLGVHLHVGHAVLPPISRLTVREMRRLEEEAVNRGIVE